MGALEAFLVVARCRTLAAASAELNLSVSALSRRVQSLEAYVGKPLFERLHHELRPTANGEWLLSEATPAFDALAQALGNLKDGGEHRLAIGVPPSFASAWLIPRLTGFKRAHPEVELRLDSSGAPFSKLGTSLDAIIVFAEEVPDDLHSLELRPQVAFAVCALGLVRPEQDIRSALAEHAVLLHSGLPKILPLWLSAAGLDESHVGRIERYDNGPMLVAAAESGLGLALTLGDSVRFYPGEARLERPFGEAVPTPYSYHFVCKRPALRGRALRRFHNWVAAEAAADRQPARFVDQAA